MSVHRGDDGIVAEDRGDRVQEHAFAIAAGAVGEEQGVLAHGPGQAVADGALQIGLELGVPARNLAEEPRPERCITIWRCPPPRSSCSALRDRAATVPPSAGPPSQLGCSRARDRRPRCPLYRPLTDRPERSSGRRRSPAPRPPWWQFVSLFGRHRWFAEPARSRLSRSHGRGRTREGCRPRPSGCRPRSATCPRLRRA